VQAAAEGVGMYFSTGDNSGVEPPASDPYAIAVGGTTLGIGQGGQRLFETGWSTDSYLLSGNSRSWTEQQEMGAAGGGTSRRWAQPAYQAGVVSAELATPSGGRGPARVVPDISADADPLTGMAIYERDRWISPPRPLTGACGASPRSAPPPRRTPGSARSTCRAPP
jgi:subtilase family serine protease